MKLPEGVQHYCCAAAVVLKRTPSAHQREEKERTLTPDTTDRALPVQAGIQQQQKQYK